MTRVLEYLEDVTEEGERVYRCVKCSHVLGPASVDYKVNAGSFDEEISSHQPAGIGKPNSDFVLRHYICPSCGVLIEVDMVLQSDEPIRSVSLA